eukprot:TRINITY_DN28445_c0_g1_i1.p1 TRINITY_DN28445_c0_g1~~TRINITY_DN28445_c0_g1_i1.p1  ORF type:complete len:140 (-),score=21.19 TRINITY_DN28445_c0_g1_i1:75-470(-)
MGSCRSVVARYRRVVTMGKFSLTRLIMCAKYQKLSSEDYIRLGLCMPDSCPDCADGSGHYVKNDKMVKNNLLLNNQVPDDKLTSQQPLKKIVNNLANDTPCNKCKESLISRDTKSCVNNCLNGRTPSSKGL